MPNRPVSQVIKGQKLVFADRDTPVQEAAQQMRDAKIGAILIMENSKVAGIFTERDCLYRVVASGKNPSEVTLGDVFSINPSCVHQERPFKEALYLMLEGGFRHVPVLDDNGCPVGIVTPRDMLGNELVDFESKEIDRSHIAEIL